MSIRRRATIISAVTFLAMVIVLLITKPSSPAGHYVASARITADGDFYYELEDGQMSLVFHELSTNGGPVTFREPAGDYFKTNGEWVYFARSDFQRNVAVPVYLENSWLGVSFSAAGDSRLFLRRRFLPFWRPKWMMDWLPWYVQ